MREAGGYGRALDDLRRETRKAGFFAIATHPAEKTLPAGRNAHLIQHPSAWDAEARSAA